MDCVLAQDEKPVELSVERVGSKVIAEYPQSLPWELRPPKGEYNAGYYEFTYLITGVNLSAIKQDSLVITKLQMKDGTDISKTFNGMPSYKETSMSLYEVSDDGKYAGFKIGITPDKVIPTEFPIVEGKITVCVADGTEVYPLKFPEGTMKSQTAGGYTIKIFNDNMLMIIVNGPSEGIAGIEIISGGKKLDTKYAGGSRSPNERQWHFSTVVLHADTTINLILWKNLREQTVSF